MTTTWDAVEDALAHEEWNWILLARDPVVSLYTPGDGFLGVHDAELSSHERAELCREGFAPVTLPPEGRFWLWKPPHAKRLRHQPLGWGVAHQRDQRALHVLRTVLLAEPEQVTLVLRFSRQTG